MNSYAQVPSGNTSQDLRRTISEFIKSYVGNDPIEPWILCIKWLKETYPPGSVQPVLQEVLEACTKNFLADRRYKSDHRYLRVWIQYADCCTEPGAIFPFLEANGVGLEHSLFYEAYATLLEYCRDFAKANDIYGIGISRQAQPVERLKSMYQLFCNRMMARHRRKVREDQKAFAARIQGGAQRPLVDQYSVGDLGQFQAFQNPISKGVLCAPLPDMHVGNVGETHGGPAPILIGSEIYESTASKGEASFEERRLLHWTQNRNEQRDILKSKTFGIDENNVGSSPSSISVKATMRESEIPQSSNRRAAEMMGFSFGAEKSNMHEIPRQNVLLNSNASQAGHLEQAQYMKSNSRLLGGFQTVNVGAPLQTTLPPIREPISSPRLSLGFRHLPTATAVTQSPDQFIAAGVDPNAIDKDTTSLGVMLDCTINTRSVTEDILSMFSGPLACEQLKPKTPPSGFIKGKVSSSGTQEVNFQFSYNQEVKSPQLINERPQGEILPHCRLQDSAVKPSDLTVRLGYSVGNSVYKSSNATIGHDLALTNDVEQPGHSTAVSGAVVRKDYMVSAYPRQGSWSQAVVHEDTSKSACYREGIQASEHPGSCVEAKSNYQESGDKKFSSFQQMGNFNVFQNHEPPVSAVVQQSSAFISKQLSPVWEDTESPGGNCNAMEDLLHGKSAVGLRQDLNIGHMDTNYRDETANLRVVAGTKRPLEPTNPTGSQSLLTENGQHSYEDEKGNVISRESKKPKVHMTSVSVELHGVLENDILIAKMDKAEVIVSNEQSSSHPEPGRMAIARCTNLSASLQATSPRRSISEAKPLSRGGRTSGGVVLAEKVYPWDDKLIRRFLEELHPPLDEYKGFFRSTKKYSGKVTLASLKSGVKNKTLELGREKYQLKGCTGRGAFAQVYLAEVLAKNGGDGQRIVLKVQKPACPWEFYIYRQLDIRIPCEERASFGRAQNMHIYADCSFMVCDFGEHGTLQDVINAYLAKGQRMDEGLCLYYTIEMLLLLENLHKVGLIHGDFKPDNLLIRSTSEQLQSWAPNRPGCWKNQGVCLIDWGRSIDTTLFTDGTEFVGDSKTDGFRCTEMLEKKPWTYQVDTYGLCGVVHCLLHGSYMEIEKRSVVAASQPIYRPKAPFKRYWNVELWQNFFDTLLNLKTGKSHKSLIGIRKSFEDYLQSDPALVKKLRELLMKQNTMLRSRK